MYILSTLEFPIAISAWIPENVLVSNLILALIPDFWLSRDFTPWPLDLWQWSGFHRFLTFCKSEFFHTVGFDQGPDRSNSRTGSDPRAAVWTALHYTIRVDSTPIFLYFDVYLYSAYAPVPLSGFKLRLTGRANFRVSEVSLWSSLAQHWTNYSKLEWRIHFTLKTYYLLILVLFLNYGKN